MSSNWAPSASRSPSRRPIATFDITARCPLRCAHCYFFAAPAPGPDLPEASYLERLRLVRDTYGIRSAFWVGGEPLLRLPLLRRAMSLFPRNAVATSGTLSIPTDLGAGLLVSLDGPKPLHDALRGQGTFDRVLRHVAVLPRRSFALSAVLTARTLEALEALPELVAETGALGVLVGFHVGPPGDPLRLDGALRDEALARLRQVIAEHPGVVLNPVASLEFFRARAAVVDPPCIYRDRAVAFDTQLTPKQPCTFGPRADCTSCGCPVMALHASRGADAGASDELLRALFPRREVLDG